MSREGSDTYPATLLQWRKNMELTQAEAADCVGMPRRTWQDQEKGLHVPPAWVQAMVIDKIDDLWRERNFDEACAESAMAQAEEDSLYPEGKKD
jgi:DNA-binding XRE family transcriptional regulator